MRSYRTCRYNYSIALYVHPKKNPICAHVGHQAYCYQLAYQLQYHINGYRSAISSLHPHINKITVGEQPRIVQAMKAIFNLRSPMKLRFYKQFRKILQDPNLIRPFKHKVVAKKSRSYLENSHFHCFRGGQNNYRGAYQSNHTYRTNQTYQRHGSKNQASGM